MKTAEDAKDAEDIAGVAVQLDEITGSIVDAAMKVHTGVEG